MTCPLLRRFNYIREDALKTAGSRRGFTLTELVVALGILVLLMAMILPSLGPMRRQARRCAGGQHAALTGPLCRACHARDG